MYELFIIRKDPPHLFFQLVLGHHLAVEHMKGMARVAASGWVFFVCITFSRLLLYQQVPDLLQNRAFGGFSSLWRTFEVSCTFGLYFAVFFRQ